VRNIVRIFRGDVRNIVRIFRGYSEEIFLVLQYIDEKLHGGQSSDSEETLSGVTSLWGYSEET